MIKRDKNHPSVFARSIFNEAETITQAPHDCSKLLLDLDRELDSQRRPVSPAQGRRFHHEKTLGWKMSARGGLPLPL